jgi:hypothetical protein
MGFNLSFVVSAIVLLATACAVLPASAATYYVSSTMGNDASSGTSGQLSWRSLAKVNSAPLRPGDTVLLRRGDEWRETLNPSSSGTVDSPIVIASFGTGAAPRILGSVSRTGTSFWTEESPRVWYTSQIDQVARMVFHDGVGSTPRSAKSAMTADWDWFYEASSKRLYYRLGENPGRHSIEVALRNGIGWTWAHHVTVRDVEIAFAEMGIGLNGSDGWVIDGVSIHDVAVDAVHGNRGADGIRVVNSIIADWNWRGAGSIRGAGDSFKGYGIHVLGNPAGIPSDEWTIENNRLSLLKVPAGEDSTAIAIDVGGHARSISGNTIQARPATGGGGIMVWRPHGFSPVRIEANRIDTVGGIGILVQDFGVTGFESGVEISRNVVANACGQDNPDEEAIRAWTGNNAAVLLRDNLVNTVAAGLHQHPGIRVRQSRASVLSNTVYRADVGISIERGSSADIRNNVISGDRTAALVVDGSSQYKELANLLDGAVMGVTPSSRTLRIDPQFVDPASGDFGLRSTSPAIDAGDVVPSSVIDLVGSPRPAGPGWDMGAMEAVSLGQGPRLPSAPNRLRFLQAAP